MKPKLGLLLVGIVLGGLAGGAVWLAGRPARQAAVEELAADRRQLRSEIATLQKRIAQLERDNARLSEDKRVFQSATPTTPGLTASGNSGRRPRPTSPLAGFFGGGTGGTNKTGEVFSNMMKAGLQHHVEGKISALKLRLKLTDEQETAIRERMQAQFDRAGEVASRMFQGKGSRAEMLKMGGMEADAETAIRDLLTPEQAIEYDKYRQEERQLQAARVANMELLKMQGALQLTTEQQEQVYNILYDQNLKAMSASGAERWAGWQEQMKARTEALRGVLTPEQFQAYEKQQEAQQKMLSNLMQVFSGGSNNADGVSIQVEVAP